MKMLFLFHSVLKSFTRDSKHALIAINNNKKNNLSINRIFIITTDDYPVHLNTEDRLDHLDHQVVQKAWIASSYGDDA